MARDNEQSQLLDYACVPPPNCVRLKNYFLSTYALVHYLVPFLQVHPLTLKITFLFVFSKRIKILAILCLRVQGHKNLLSELSIISSQFRSCLLEIQISINTLKWAPSHPVLSTFSLSS